MTKSPNAPELRQDRTVRLRWPGAGSRNTRFHVALILLVGLAVRLGFWSQRDPQELIQGGDAVWYLQQSWEIAEGRLDEPLKTVGPLYPLVLAGFWKLFSSDVSLSGQAPPATLLNAVRLSQIGISLISILFVFGLIRRLTCSPGAACVVGLALALSPALAMEPFGIRTETLFLFLLTAAIWMYSREGTAAGSRGILGAGMLLGLAGLTRPVALLLPVLLAPHLYVTSARAARVRCAGFLAGFFVITMPWLGYLRTTTSDWLPQGFAANLWIGAAGQGRWVDKETHDAARRRFAEGPDDYVGETVRVVRENPMRWFRLRAWRWGESVAQPHGTVDLQGPSIKALARSWVTEGGSPSLLVELVRADGFATKLVIYLLHYAALGLGLAGMLAAGRRWKEFYPFYCVVLYFPAVHFFLAVVPRYLLPSAFFLWVFAGLALAKLLTPGRPVPNQARTARCES